MSHFILLFDPEAFHIGNYTEIIPQTKNPTNVGLDVVERVNLF